MIVIFGKFPQNLVNNISSFSSLDKSVGQKNKIISTPVSGRVALRVWFLGPHGVLLEKISFNMLEQMFTEVEIPFGIF